MNHTILMVKIQSKIEQTLFSENMSVVEFLGELLSDKKKKSKDQFFIRIWGNAGNHLIQDCKKGDCIVLEGAIRFRLLDHPSGKKKNLEFTATKFYSFAKKKTVSFDI